MLEHGGRGFWPGCRQAAVVANAIIRKTRAAGVYKVIKQKKKTTKTIPNKRRVPRTVYRDIIGGYTGGL